MPRGVSELVSLVVIVFIALGLVSIAYYLISANVHTMAPKTGGVKIVSADARGFDVNNTGCVSVNMVLLADTSFPVKIDRVLIASSDGNVTADTHTLPTVLRPGASYAATVYACGDAIPYPGGGGDIVIILYWSSLDNKYHGADTIHAQIHS